MGRMPGLRRDLPLGMLPQDLDDLGFARQQIKIVILEEPHDNVLFCSVRASNPDREDMKTY